MPNTRAKILIVDDRLENIRALEITLQQLDIDIYSALSGNAALTLMVTHDFAVVLMDVQMPGMDGFETASLMQHNRQTRNIPIIFITAISKDEQHIFKGYQSGAVDYLFKPINADILLCKVNVFLKLYETRIECEMMQEEVNRSKNLESLGILAGGIAHDFNNLLTAIFGNIELARKFSVPGGKAELLLQNSSTAIDRSRELTKQLLTFSKGGTPIKRATSITALITNACSAFQARSSSNVTINIPQDIRSTKIDTEQISQVFHSMLVNADEAMPEGGEISITAENVTINPNSALPLKQGKYLKITMSDTGPGIPEEIVGKIFDPYFSTKQQCSQKGLGLGLAICHSIITRHGGCLQAESEKRRGAVFYIYLPAIEIEPLAGSEQAALDSTPYAPSKRGPKRILLMDDEEFIIQVTGDILESLGYDYESARNGEEALKLFIEAKKERRPFDAVILDLSIRKGMGGTETIKRMLKIDKYVRAIVASGYSEDDVMKNFRDYGFLAAIAKPFDINGLEDAIKQILDK